MFPFESEPKCDQSAWASSLLLQLGYMYVNIYYLVQFDYHIEAHTPYKVAVHPKIVDWPLFIVILFIPLYVHIGY